MTATRALAVAIGLLVALPSAAEDEVLPPPELPEVKLERIPPRASYDVAVQFGVHEITYWRAEVQPWMGLGFRTSWGPNFGAHRIGPMLNFSAEGPVPVHMTLATEPLLNWDWVMGDGGLGVGAAIGPAILVHHSRSTTAESTVVGLAPVAAVRIGYSQGWTRVGRRLFVMLEPRARIIHMPVGIEEKWVFNPSLALVVGSGRGY
jgi:hypothetical protein